VLAYVFWHVPRPSVEAEDYEASLAGFHAALRAAGGPWLGATTTFALGSVPWLGGAAGYEDWYLVDGFAALGTLNAAAVTGAPRAPHDAAAHASRTGIAGIMGHVAGTRLPAAPGRAAWIAKPDGVGYRDFHAQLAERLPPGASAWQRQMVLGPATEYCILSDGPLGLPWPAAYEWPLRVAVATGG
jgi:hypothetical protein